VNERDAFLEKIELTDQDYYYITDNRKRFLYHGFLLLGPQLLSYALEHLSQKHLKKAKR
jgi:hypothetical protein